MKRNCLFFMVLLSLLAFAGVAHAEGHGDISAFDGWVYLDMFKGHYDLERYILRVTNFLLFGFLIWKFAGSKVASFFGGRREGIKGDLDTLQARQLEAEKKLKEVEAGIANMGQEKEAILAEARQQGEVLKEGIIAKAEKDAEALKEQAKRTASNEAQAAVETIRAEMADMVVAAAEKIVAEKLSAEDHDKLVDDYLTKVVLN